MLNYYERVSLQLNEPLYTRPVAPMLKLRRKHTYSGHAFAKLRQINHAYAKLRQINVRGEPHRLIPVRPSTRLAAGTLSLQSYISNFKPNIFSDSQQVLSR
jgi:hypothetical protein